MSIQALKKAEDGDEVVVRLREQTGEKRPGVRVSLGPGQAILSAARSTVRSARSAAAR